MRDLAAATALIALEPGGARVAVIGAGLAGLTAATTLARRGTRVVLFEAGRSVGGLAVSHRDAGGFTHDVGAHFITNRLAAAIGVSAQCRNVERYGESVFCAGNALVSARIDERTAIPLLGSAFSQRGVRPSTTVS